MKYLTKQNKAKKNCKTATRNIRLEDEKNSGYTQQMASQASTLGDSRDMSPNTETCSPTWRYSHRISPTFILFYMIKIYRNDEKKSRYTGMMVLRLNSAFIMTLSWVSTGLLGQMTQKSAATECLHNVTDVLIPLNWTYKHTGACYCPGCSFVSFVHL